MDWKSVGPACAAGAEAARRSPHAPAGPVGEGPNISFARAGLTVSWNSRFQSLLEFAEACDVPVRCPAEPEFATLASVG